MNWCRAQKQVCLTKNLKSWLRMTQAEAMLLDVLPTKMEVVIGAQNVNAETRGVILSMVAQPAMKNNVAVNF